MNRLSRGVAFCVSLLASSAVFAAQPPQFPNHQRYKDNGAKPATGRSGSASVTARALLGKDTVTDLEVTTGALDSAAAPPGQIEKVQLKLTADRVHTQNFNNLSAGGAFALRMPGLARHEAFQVQTNVSGIDGRRTDIVTVAETVKLRPDLAALGLQLPQRAPRSVPINISAVVQESNGDVGATANCALRVNGTDVDQANGIWVDAAGTVTCIFTHAFDAVGAHHVQIALTGVVPGDYDTSNNVIDGDIEIVNPETNFLLYSAWVEDRNYSYWGHASAPWFTNNWHEQGRVQYARLYGWAGPIDFTRASASVTHSTDGITLSADSYDLTQGSYWSDGTRSEGCFWGWVDYRYFYACGSTYFDGVNVTGSSFVDTSRNAGDVTYHSDGWCSNYLCGYGYYYYTWNYDSHNVYGQFAPIGSTYRIDVSITDGDRTFFTRPVIQLQPNNFQDDVNRCYDAWYQGGQVCEQYHYENVGAYGWAYGPN